MILTRNRASQDAAHDLVLGRHLKTGRAVIDGDRSEAPAPRLWPPLAGTQVREAERECLGGGGKPLLADARTEAREIPLVDGVGAFGRGRSSSAAWRAFFSWQSLTYGGQRTLQAAGDVQTIAICVASLTQKAVAKSSNAKT
jgi:hypothetical protein